MSCCVFGLGHLTSWASWWLQLQGQAVLVPEAPSTMVLEYVKNYSPNDIVSSESILSTSSDNKVRKITTVKVVHTSLLNTTMVAFKILPLGSYAPTPAPSPPFKTILELVLWNGLQSCHCITPSVITVINMPSFQYFLYVQEQKKSHWGLDPVNRQGVPTQLFV